MHSQCKLKANDRPQRDFKPLCFKPVSTAAFNVSNIVKVLTCLSSLGADQWLSEATFLTGKGPGEAIDQITESPEEAGIVKVGHDKAVTLFCGQIHGQIWAPSSYSAALQER